MTQDIQPDYGNLIYLQRHKTAFQWIGWLLLIIGLGTVLLYGQNSRLYCVRQAGGGVDCLTQVFWFDLFVLSRPESIHDVVLAEPSLNCDSVGRTSRYECEFTQVKLSSAESSLIIGSHFLNTLTARETSDRVNDYLQHTSNQPLVISNRNFWITLQGLICVTPAFVLLGLLLIRGYRVLYQFERSTILKIGLRREQ